VQTDYSKIVKRTVVIKSKQLPYDLLKEFKKIEQVYKEMLLELIEYVIKNNVKSRSKLHKVFYRKFREKYPWLPSHYIHGAIGDALTRVKSFNELKKKGKAYTNKPVVKRVTIHVDSVLHKVYEDYISISTSLGRIKIYLQKHKHWSKYFNDSWKVSNTNRFKVKDNELVFYITFKKECKVVDRPNVLVIDLNENNATIGISDGKSIQLLRYEYKLGDIVRRYHYKRRYIQMKYGIHRKGVSPNLNPIFRKAMEKIKFRERRRKRDIIYKFVNFVINLAKKYNANIYVGLVNKEKIVNNCNNGELKHRLFQWSVKTIINTLIDKGFEHGVRVVTINEAYTSSICPICGSRLTKNPSPMTHHVVRRGVMNTLRVKVLKFKFRIMKCHKCGLEEDRDVIAVLNMLKRTGKWVPPTLGTTAQTLIWGCGNPQIIKTQININKN